MRRYTLLPAIFAIVVGIALNCPLIVSAARADTPPATAQTAAPPPPAAPVTSLATAWKSLGEVPGGRAKAMAYPGISIVVAIVLILAVRKSGMLRDAEPRDFGTVPGPAAGKAFHRPFSLARTQMAWWFFLVLSGFLYLYYTKGELNLSGQALALMGIGTGTALGAAMIENAKTNPDLAALQAVNAALAATPPPANAADLKAQQAALVVKLSSKNFLSDILSDANGISLHRFQSVVWTFVLGAIFLIEVTVHRAMPNYDGNLLALLGISSGAYLGFKIPEQPT